MNKKSNIKIPDEIDLKIVDLYKNGISFSYQKAYDIIKHLYQHAEMYLDRKYELAQQS